MKFLKLIFLLACLPFAAVAQDGQLIKFGGSRGQDTAYAARSLRIDSVVRLLRYATADTNKVLGLNAQGILELRSKGTGGGSSYTFTSPLSETGSVVSINLSSYATNTSVADTAAALRAVLNTKVGTETDPVVKAINGLVKSNGSAISAAVAGTDYLTPTGSAAGLTSFPTLNQNTTGSAATLTTGRTLGITGDLVWTSPSFNGSANVTAAGTLANTGVTAGSYNNVNLTVDAKGRITAASNGSSGGAFYDSVLMASTKRLKDSMAAVDAKFANYYLASNPSGYISSYTETDPLFDTKFSSKTTTNLTEGTNLYHTNSRVLDVINNDTGRAVAQLATGGSLNKVRDSLQANINLKLNIANPTATGVLTAPNITISSIGVGSASDSVVTIDAATGILYRRAFPSSGGGSGWALTGNSGTTGGTNFIGTTDAQRFDIRANNVILAKYYSTTNSIAQGELATCGGNYNFAAGYNAVTGASNHEVAIGFSSQASATRTTAVCHTCAANATDAAVVGNGNNYTENTTGGTTIGGYGGIFMSGGLSAVSTVKIGRDAGKALEITSTTGMFVPPIYTGSAAEALATKIEGGMLYSSDGSGATITSKGWWGWNGTTWEKLNP